MSKKNPGKAIAVSVLAVTFAVIAVPVYGQSQLQGFFNPSYKYREWFDQTSSRRVFLEVSENSQASESSIAAKYPYPDKDFVMTEAFWKKSSNAIAGGKSDWFDTEIIRQRAEVEKYPPGHGFPRLDVSGRARVEPGLPQGFHVVRARQTGRFRKLTRIDDENLQSFE